MNSFDASAAELLHISRAHWKIEGMHWMLDENFAEDECQRLSENGQKSLNAFRKLALFFHRDFLARQAKKQKLSVKANLLRCLIRENVLLEIIGRL